MGLFNLRLFHRSRDTLDERIAWLSESDPVSLRALLRSVAGFGATGSGKSSALVRWLAAGILSHPRATLLLCFAKPEDKRDWQRYFALAGRPDDLLIFEPGGSRQFNVLDYILKQGGTCRDVTRCLMTINETMRSGDGTGKDEFWEMQQERAIYNAAVIVKHATGGVSAPHMQEFLTGAAHTPAQLNSDAFREGNHNAALRAALSGNKTAEDAADLKIAKDFFVNELPYLADKTASSILIGVHGLFHAICTGQARFLFSEETNVTPQTMLREGKSIAVNMSPAQYGALGKLGNAIWKFATQWSVLRRDAEPTDFFNVIFCDEAQMFVNSGDSDYLAQCRSHLGCMVYFTQSRPSYYEALGTVSGHDKTDALLANFNLKCFCALGDVETAQWASELVGRKLQMRFGGSSGPQDDMWETLMGRSKSTSNFSMQMENILEPNVLMHGMRTGGPENQYLVDAMVVKTGEPFASGTNWMWTTFKQR